MKVRLPMTNQRTFEITHLRDYLRTAQGIHEMFERLGYTVNELEALGADALDFNDTDADNVKAFYVVGSADGIPSHNIWLFEVADTTSLRLRAIAYELLARGESHTILVTKDYTDVVFVHPYVLDGQNLTKSNTRVSKLTVNVKHPTRHDVDTINALLAYHRDPIEIYKAQDDAFNVTKVTNKFYKEYRAYFEQVKETVVAWNKGIAAFQNSDQRDKLHAFVQRLMGRLMFLYFLQRKGWLGGDANFLTTQYRQMIRRHAGELSDTSTYYYREVLEPLFFDTLNNPKRPDMLTDFDVAGGKAKIPYLNGGLFDRKRDPEGTILLPDTLFDSESNTGVLAFLNRYNFTIADDTPLEQDVAVDPEMLGKVFENMLEEDDRGQSGSFYTPRTIVSYMCQEALAGYLEESTQAPNSLARDDVRQLFDPDSDFVLTPEQAQQADEALDTLTVLDPAVGSGSFLVGMMNEIITIRRKIADALGHVVTPETIASWKEHIIRDTLYGVDIKQGAIEIAQLRLWLSLVVNQTIDDAKPLPNLDYKLMAGNSLIETINGEPILTESARALLEAGIAPRQRGLFEGDADENANKLAELRKDYFTANPDRRAELGEDIRYRERKVIETGLNDLLEQVQNGIANLEKKYKTLEASGWNKKDAKQYKDLLEQEAKLEDVKRDLWNDEATLPFFLYRLHFNDVFATKGGFDVVVANPPYVRQELIKEQKPELAVSYTDVYAGTADLFVYFFARAFDIMTHNGQLSFITPNKFMRAKYGTKLRGYLANKVRLQTLIDFGDLPIFDATTYPMITIANKHDSQDNTIKVLEITSLADSETLAQATTRAFDLDQHTLSSDGWQLSSPDIRALMDKLKQSGQPLKAYVNDAIHYGIKTGLNKAFIIDEAKRDELIATDPKSAEVIKPYLRGRDIKRWEFQFARLYILFIRPKTNINDYPAIKAHLLKHRSKLSKKAGNNQWYELQTNVAYYQEFDKPKIVYPDIAKRPEFCLDTSCFYINDTTFMMPIADFFLLGVLNSLVTFYYFSKISSTVRGGFLRFKNIYVKRIPIPDAPDNLRQQIADLAQKCLDVAKDDPSALPALEDQLNQLVYQAYGLDAEDIAVIESHLNSKG
jgi:type I restriction-modification system DNA methylase subunit